jgi:HEAT repeat protein
MKLTAILTVILVLGGMFYSLCGCTTKTIVGRNRTDNSANEKQNKSSQASSFTKEELDIIINLDTLEKQWEQGFNSGLVKKQAQTAEKIRDAATENMPILRKAMQNDGVEEKMIATLALGFTADDKDVIAMLVAATQDKNMPIRMNAACSLGLLSDKSTPPESLIKLLEDEEPSVRNAAAYALSRILDKNNSRDAIIPLHNALNDQSPEVRRWIVCALTVISSKESLPYFIKCLKDSDEFVRINAALALGVLKDSSALGDLIAALDDKEPRVRDAAIYSLQGITGVTTNYDVKMWQEWWNKNKADISPDKK